MSEERLSKETVEHIARLARLELSSAELALYQDRLGRVLGYVKELSSVKTDPKAVVQHVPRDVVALREDRVLDFANTRKLLANAPEKSEDSFLLPAVLDGSNEN